MSEKRKRTPSPENKSNKNQKLSTPLQSRPQPDAAQQAINVLATMGNRTYRGLQFDGSSPDGNAGKSRRKSRKKSKRKRRGKSIKKRRRKTRRTRVKKR